MPAPRVRRTTPSDVAAIAALRRMWTEEYAGHSVDDAGFEADLAEWVERESFQRVTWVAEIDGVTAGMLNLLVVTRMPRPQDPAAPRRSARQWGYVANLYVAPQYRNQGLGAELVSAATTFADESGFARLVLTPSEQAMGVYGRAGFGPGTTLLLRPGPA
jgi:GNAT superfamily N-acetyltransferase